MRINKCNFQLPSYSLFSLLIIGCSIFFSCNSAQSAPPATITVAPSPLPAIPTPEKTVPPPSSNFTNLFKADGIASTGEYSASNTYGDYFISWFSDSENIYVFMQAKTKGFVAVGLQPGTAMLNADIVFGYVKDGQAIVEDLFSTGSTGPHELDTTLGGTNDIIEFGGLEKDGITSIEFKRRLNTNDKYDLPINRGINRIIWAFGNGDSMQFKHIVRGYGEIRL